MSSHIQQKREYPGRTQGSTQVSKNEPALATKLPGDIQLSGAAQRLLHEHLNSHSQVRAQAVLEQSLNQSSPVVAQAKRAESLQRQISREGQEKEEQEKATIPQGHASPIQREQETPEKRAGSTSSGASLPDDLRAGVEHLSGLSMHDVGVEYNSSEPAQYQALAITQGKTIKVGPGQEKHLPHEAWHVVQQKQGRVRPTTSIHGTAVNTEKHLEQEADEFGEKAKRIATTQVLSEEGYGAIVSASVNAPLQMLSIAGEHIYPSGKNGKELFAKVKLSMLSQGLSPHGASPVFKQVASENWNFESEDDFLTQFIIVAYAEVARVEQERVVDKKAKGWTRPLKLHRPNWPKAYKGGATEGQDIRHIVRNATLKNAIEGEQKFQVEHHGEEAALEVMKGIAEALGIAGTYPHSFLWTAAIYRQAYLNPGNLFFGAGAVNRIIGLTADGITQIGQALIASSEIAQPQTVTTAFHQVGALIAKVTEKVEDNAREMAPDAQKQFLGGFESFAGGIESYLTDMQEELIQRIAASSERGEHEAGGADEDSQAPVMDADVGRELVDIGANFGFDIPDEVMVSSDMQQLIQTEISLAQYMPGNPGRLATALTEFMQIKGALHL